jgi:hypothetical protein
MELLTLPLRTAHDRLAMQAALADATYWELWVVSEELLRRLERHARPRGFSRDRVMESEDAFERHQLVIEEIKRRHAAERRGTR